MFTTLSIVNEKGRKFGIKKARQYISKELHYKNYTFYSTLLLTRRKNNQKSISRFYKRADMPIITEDCPAFLQYKFITRANTVMQNRNYKSIGIYDTNGTLVFLLPFLSKKSGIICIFTNNPDAYTNACYEIYRDFGTPTLITDRLSRILNTEIIFSAENIPIKPKCEIITPDTSAEIYIPDTLYLPEDCDPFLACAGLYFYGGFKEFGRLKQKEG